MMMGEEGNEELGPVDEWPPPTTSAEMTNKEGSSSRLLFLTVQYVGEEAGNSFHPGLPSMPDLDQDCGSCYTPIIPQPGQTPFTCNESTQPYEHQLPDNTTADLGSPAGGYLSVPSPSLEQQGMIVLSESSNYVMSASAQPSDNGKLLLLADPSQPAEMMVGEQRVELLLSNGTIAYGIVEPPDSNGTRIIQIPREYLVDAQPQNTELAEEDVNSQTITEEGVEENDNLQALLYTLKEQGLIIDSGDLQAASQQSVIDSSNLDSSAMNPSAMAHPAMDPSVMDPSAMDPSAMDPSALDASAMDPSVMDSSALDHSAINLSIMDPSVINSPLIDTPPAQHRFWCEECDMLLETVCREHQINRKISDKAVPSRAWATLPASYLSINPVFDSGVEEYGVFARKTIPKRTQFGPMEGVVIKMEDVTIVQEGPHLELTVESDKGQLSTLDVSSEHMSNWMRFVRPATPERHANLLVSQIGASLFFTSTHSIHAREELVVWYNPVYATRRNLPVEPPPPVWTCSTCEKKMKTHQELMDHSTVHIQQLKREENLTVNSLREKNKALVATVNKDLSEEDWDKCLYQCAICNKRFLRSYSLKRHILLLHTRGNKYHCKVCNLGFSHSYNRLKHMRKAHHSAQSLDSPNVHRYESWSCSRCKLTFNSASMLNTHSLVHTVQDVEPRFLKAHDTVRCPQCPLNFINKYSLAKHVAVHGKSKDPKDKKFHCEHCGRNFISAVRFEAHKESHKDDDQKPLQCHICMKRLLTESALACHLRIHDCNYQWQCPMCKDHYSNLLTLKNHVRTHAVDGNYYCPHCNKMFQEYSGIRKHIRAFHPVRAYRCEVCGKAFPSQDKLRMHLLRHSEWREFLCADCGKQFKRKDKLKEHMKRMHSAPKDSPAPAPKTPTPPKKLFTKIMSLTDYERYIYKCHSCVLGFKRRGMLVNHLANRHPDITPESVPELNLPILRTTRDYYCQYCDKIYKSSSKRKAHILKNHPGLELPMSSRQKGGVPDIPGLPNPTFSQTVGSVTTNPHGCQWCHKQYASKAKLIQHQQKKHINLEPHSKQEVTDVLENEQAQAEQMLCDIVDDEEPVPVALSTNINHQIMLSATNLNQLQEEYEIIGADYENGGNGVLDASPTLRKGNYKHENISSDLLSQAMSEIGVSLTDLQYMRLLQSPGGQDSLYPAR